MTIVDPERLAAAGLAVELDDAVLTVTLNKPDRRNSQTPRLWHALAAIGEALPEEVLAAIREYAGAIVLVTHDEGAVHALEPDRVLILPDGVEDLWTPDYADLVALA